MVVLLMCSVPVERGRQIDSFIALVRRGDSKALVREGAEGGHP